MSINEKDKPLNTSSTIIILAILIGVCIYLFSNKSPENNTNQNQTPQKTDDVSQQEQIDSLKKEITNLKNSSQTTTIKKEPTPNTYTNQNVSTADKQIKQLQQQILNIKQKYFIDSQYLQDNQTPEEQKAWNDFNKVEEDINQHPISYSIDTGIGISGRIAATQGIRMEKENSNLQLAIWEITEAQQAKKIMSQNLLNTTNQKIEQLNLQIQQLQLTGN